MIDLCTIPTDTKTCELESKTPSKKKLPETIARRHSFMMKFLTHRNALFMIPELPSLEEQYSSSFTAGTPPVKPRTQKTVKTKKNKKSKAQTALAKALSIVDSENMFKSTTRKSRSPLQSSQNSLTTCSTASLSDEESDISSKGNFEKPRATEGKREAADLWDTPLLRGNRRWCEKNLGDEHYMYVNVHGRRRDSPPVCPVRTYDEYTPKTSI